MGNQQPRKLAKATKGQIDIACLKAKFHLELSRDRKNTQIIKGQKELVNKLRSSSRNKIQEILIAERVVTGLKYAQACNLLMSCAVSLKGHALYLADNQDKPEKMEPWLPFIYSLIYGADHLGLSSLNEFKSVMKSLNDPIAVPKYTNAEIVQLLSPSPTPQELNMYIVQMSERNQIPLEEINMVGHQFTKEYVHPLTPEQILLQQQLAESLKNKFDNGWGGQGNPGSQPQQGQGFSNQGQGQGGYGGQGQGGFGGQGQGGFGGQGGNQGGFNGGQGYNGGFNGQGGMGGSNNQNPYTVKNPGSNIYLDNQPPKNFNIGPTFNMINTVKKQESQNKPRQFNSFQDIIGLPEDPNKGPIYPSIEPTKISSLKYSPEKKGGVDNPFARQSIVEVNGKGQPTTSPTISQILRDFK